MCDICTSADETLQLSADQMRTAVENGFDPFTSRLVNQSTIDQWSRGAYGEIYGAPGPLESKDFTPAYQAALENWRRDLVETETSPWRFCSECATNVRQFTSYSPVITRSAEELRGEQTVSDIALGHLGSKRRKWWQFWK